MCIDTLLPFVLLSLLWAKRDLVLIHHEVVASYLSFARAGLVLLNHTCVSLSKASSWSSVVLAEAAIRQHE